MKHIPDFRGILVVDEQGRTEYCSINDADFFEVDFRKVRGTTVLQWYENRTTEESSVMNAVINGIESFDVEDILTTASGKVVRQISDTLCIRNKGKVAGAVELTRFDPEKDVLVQGAEEKRDIFDVHRITEDDFIGTSDAIETIKNKVLKIKNIDASIFITGATGTGKEALARVIHNAGNRKDRSFVYVNCGALPEALLESILFGTEKGAFTDAETRSGLFEEADGGTLFLDELDSMPLFVQGKLLKAIEEKRIRKVGGNKDINVDVRIIAACNSKTRDLIREDKIRSDLFFRLSSILISLPPLTGRLEDIPALSEYFLKRFNDRFNKSIKGLEPEVLEKFNEYSWPGNVRELRNVIEGAFHAAKEEMIQLADVEQRFQIDDEIKNIKNKQWEDFISSGMNINEYIDRFEMNEINKALDIAGGNMTEACKLLGITKSKLRHKLEKQQMA